MKILYDHQIFTLQKYGGISRYFAELIKHLPDEIAVEVGIKYSNNEYIKQLSLGTNIKKIKFSFESFLPRLNFRGKHRLFNFISNIDPSNALKVNNNITIELLKKQDFDVFHATYYDDYFLDYIGNKPFVINVHDMTPELYPEMLMDSLQKRKANLLRKADHIISVSENTKKDLMDILDIPESKISVIYHGVTTLNNNQDNKLSLPKKYILFVGDRIVYKNFLFFALSVVPILNKDRNLFLVCTGKEFTQKEKNYLTEIGIFTQTICIKASDNQLYTIYKNAIAFIFPSYYEGFGLPILEAFQVGCPLLLAKSSCFPEIAGDAALYFNPKNIVEIRQLINEIITNQDLRQTMILKGRERIKHFSWEKSAQSTVEVYKNVLNIRALSHE